MDVNFGNARVWQERHHLVNDCGAELALVLSSGYGGYVFRGEKFETIDAARRAAEAFLSASPTPASPAALQCGYCGSPVSANDLTCAACGKGMHRYHPTRVSGSRQTTHWDDCWRDSGHHACAVARIERMSAALPVEAQPVAWLFTCVRPGKRMQYASVLEDDNGHWPLDQWTSVVREPLGRIAPASSAKGDGADSDTPNNTSAKEEGAK